MIRRIVAVWVSLAMLFGFVVIVDVVTDITTPVRGATLYVGGIDPGNYSSIQWAIDNATDGDTVFVYNGIYYENVVVDKTINLTGEDMNNTIINGSGIGDVVNVGSDWVNVSGFTIMGGGGAGIPNYDAALELNNTQYCSIFNNYFFSNKLFGLHLYSSDYNNVINNNASNNSMGISLYFSCNNTISNNSLINNNAGIYFYSNSNFNIIVNNTIINNTQDGIYQYSSNSNEILWNTIQYNRDGITMEGPDYYTISNNNISSNKWRGVMVMHGRENHISDNDMYYNSCAVYLDGTSENTLLDNIMVRNGIVIDGDSIGHWNSHTIDTSNTVNGKPLYYRKDQIGGTIPSGAGEVILANCKNVNIENQELSNGTIGIEMGFSSNNNITNNDASSHSGTSIYLAYSNGNHVIDNNASNSSTGIYLRWSDGNMIISNIVKSNINRGINVYLSDNNNLINNIVSYNDYSIFTASSAYNNITGNMVSHNQYGIFVNACSNTIVNNNNVVSNTLYGLRVGNSDFNLVYLNNVIDNNDQAYDNRNTSLWNETYDFGGNFWSDYSGYDDFSGPNQDIPGSDGIGDTPYVIDSDSQDNYPLMIPIGNYTYLYGGWNLISIPLIQSNSGLITVLSSISGYYDAVQWYNSSDSYEPWKHYSTKKPSHLNDLVEIVHTIGFWIHITEPGGVLFKYNGTQPTVNQSITLHPGWNMVGYPSLTNRNRTSALNNIDFDTDIDAIWTFDASTQTWQEIGPGDSFELGRGYWIHSKVTKVWDVPL